MKSDFEPTAEQITAALRCCGNTDTKKPDCEHCPLLSVRMCVKVMLEGAADMIIQLNDFDQTQSKIALERCQRAEAHLAESQRREQAAVEDLKASKTCLCCKNNGTRLCKDCDIFASNFEWRDPHEGGK